MRVISYNDDKINYNSYLSLEDIENVYDNIEDSIKEKLLIKSSLYIDSLYDYEGVKNNSNQNLKFPRLQKNKSNVKIPLDIIFATYEVFKLFIDDSIGKNIKSERIDNLIISYHNNDKSSLYVNNVIRTYLRKYIKRTVNLYK